MIVLPNRLKTSSLAMGFRGDKGRTSPVSSGIESSPSVSLVLPTYNQAQYLPFALDGILVQSFMDYELIVLNDGSTDATSQVLGDYAKTMSFRVVEQDNQGLPCALNAGFALAQERFLTWVSSDNIMMPAMLEKLVKALDQDAGLGLVYADWIFIDEVGRALGIFRTLDYDRHLLLRYNFVHCCFLFRRECMERIGKYDPQYIYSEDWEYWIRMSRHYRMRRIPETLCQYRLHRHSMTAGLLNGTARPRLEYADLARRLRKKAPLDWYLGLLKWRLMCWRTGRDPSREWSCAVRNLTRASC